MNRRDFVKGGTAMAALAAGSLGAPVRAFAQGGDWYDDMLVIDGLGGLNNPGAEEGVTRLTDAAWADYRATGVDATRVTVMPVGNVPDAWEAYRESIEGYDAMIAANPARLSKVLAADDILAAKRDGHLALILGTQDTYMVGPELDRIATMKEDGIRSIQLTYNNRNLSGDGSIEPDNAGLSKLGRATIERVEAEELLLDLSHAGARTMAEAVEHSTRPLAISHTGARAIADHPRNTSDAVMRAVADKGGVVGLYFMPYLAPDPADDPTGEMLLMHADHMLNVLGEDHLSIGTDNGPLPIPMTSEFRAMMDQWQQDRIDRGIAAPGERIGWYPLVSEYNSVDRYRRFAHDLVKRGWKTSTVEKMMGANFLRVCRESFG